MPDGGFNKELCELAEAVEKGRPESVVDISTLLMEKGLKANTILNEGLLPGMDVVIDKFDKLEAFLPDIIFSSDALFAGVSVLKRSIPNDEKHNFHKGTVVIGSVEGDIHDVGKTIVASLLGAHGFVVHDLGIDINSETFINRAKETSAGIIALSCLMTSTLERQREVIEDLERLGFRKRFKVMVGGGAVTQQWADEIGADGYGLIATDAVGVALGLAAC